jgi:hypothetical protein
VGAFAPTAPSEGSALTLPVKGNLPLTIPFPLGFCEGLGVNALQRTLLFAFFAIAFFTTLQYSAVSTEKVTIPHLSAVSTESFKFTTTNPLQTSNFMDSKSIRIMKEMDGVRKRKIT